MVDDGVPGIVNSDEQQQQGCRPDGEQRVVGVSLRAKRGHREQYAGADQRREEAVLDGRAAIVVAKEPDRSRPQCLGRSLALVAKVA